MTPSASCVAFIKRYETCRLKAYRPTPNDVPTIGWGSTGPDIKMGMTWTQEKADTRFAADLKMFSDAVTKLAGPNTTQGQFDALVSLAYNIGVSNLKKSTLLQKHLAGDYMGAAAEFGKWNTQKGKVLNGLTDRRFHEANQYAA